MPRVTRSALPLLAITMSALVAVALSPDLAHAGAAGGGAAMPWNTPMQSMLTALSGTTARIVIGLALCLGGFIFALSRSEEALRRVGGAIVGGAIAIGAASIVASVGFTGASL